jgi:hypothetical protein
MNRPYGAVDVSANLKGAVPKTAAQKILAALAERGELVQKTYGAHTSILPTLIISLHTARRQDDVLRAEPGQDDCSRVGRARCGGEGVHGPRGREQGARRGAQGRAGRCASAYIVPFLAPAHDSRALVLTRTFCRARAHAVSALRRRARRAPRVCLRAPGDAP